MLSSINECVFICDLNDLTVQIIFDAWWASINVGPKRTISWKDSRHALSWRFYLHCGIEETGCPGIIRIVCHPVLRHPSEHGTRSMAKPSLAKAHIAKLNELTESEVTELTSLMVDETALAIVKREGRRGITIVSSQTKFNVHIVFEAILTVVTDKTLQTGSYRLFNSRISPRPLESLPHVRICFGSYTMERYIKPWTKAVI